MDLSVELGHAAEAIVASRYVIALVGAGISVESGIPPFRGVGGLWTKHGEPPMDGYRRFQANPDAYWSELRARRASDDEFSRSIQAAEPNAAHAALARLEAIGILRHTISQNIDNLHFVAGSKAVTEIHGNRTKVRCIECGARRAWADVEATDGVPACPDCGGIVKSDTVMFGEPIPREFLAECQEQSERADCIIVAGTSATVYPAAQFPEVVLGQGGVLIEANSEETPFARHAIARLRGPAGETLPALVERIERKRASQTA